ncbi:hypothetical protein [Archangium lansingense]|uniref:Response regulatory domain-containing protein n=1 Tax=Archangium lansingense TaxID=2995310 RepID=A0ABT3ZXE5_9BACT|nr:hypothetical protein [Archangium lansinium]MCY1074065.1 hypothetical protein [Archangium lansinium]
MAPEQAERVIFMTGGAFTEQSRAFLAGTGLPCLDKPIDAQRLRALMAAMPPLGSRNVHAEPVAPMV